eukprot:TRINITY_DN45711_c0_g1_i1.p1 TRINITY_DN45711_c0_g1~~TRINITY_DN45711_c0_g1_i1.p1  ORF type:complete len:589 (+),score=70.99 TRINITY_DN45711_c0_g1_i1:57-1823(+)
MARSRIPIAAGETPENDFANFVSLQTQDWQEMVDAVNELKSQHHKSTTNLNFLSQALEDVNGSVKDAPGLHVRPAVACPPVPAVGDATRSESQRQRPKVSELTEIADFSNMLVASASKRTTPSGRALDRAARMFGNSPNSQEPYTPTTRAAQINTRNKTRLAALIEEHSLSQQNDFSSQEMTSRCDRCKVLAQRMVQARSFELFMGIVILTNAICLGIEVDRSVKGEDGIFWLQGVEFVFMGIYIFKMCLILFAGSWKTLRDPWVRFDFVLVLAGVIGVFAHLVFEHAGSFLWRQTALIRVSRLLRIIRMLRVLEYFRTAWKLVYGVLMSMDTVLSAFLLIVMAIYMMACIGLELIAKDASLLEGNTAGIVQNQFNSLSQTMLTLSEFVTLDNMAEVYIPLILAKPVLSIYFVVIILGISIALMNLVTAVLVEGALSFSNQDQELAKKLWKAEIMSYYPLIAKAFSDLDKDNSGNITIEEIEDFDLELLPQRLFDSASITSLRDVFDLLDSEGDGVISQEEFVEGLLNILLFDVDPSTFQILNILRTVRTKLGEVQKEITRVQTSQRSLHEERNATETPLDATYALVL